MRDLRFGWRTLGRSPGFTLVAVLILALGIGSVVAAVALARTVFFNRLPYEQPEEIVVFWRHSLNFPRTPLSIPTFRDIEERNRSFDPVAMFRPFSIPLVDGAGEPERVRGEMVSAGFLRVLGIKLYLGRDFQAADDQQGAKRTVILSYELWQRRFGGAREFLGQIIRLDDQQYTVVGVLPPGFRNDPLQNGGLGDVLVPISLFFDKLPVDERDIGAELLGVGRLKPQLTQKDAREDLARVSRELAQDFAPSYDGSFIECTGIREYIITGSATTLRLLGLVGLVVLIVGSANLANLVLVRTTYRKSEFATRMSLGATPRRLRAMLLTENLVLALLSSVGAVFLAGVALRLLPSILRDDLPYVDQARLDLFMVCLALALAILTCLVLAWISATNLGKSQLACTSAIRSTGASRRLRHALVVVELALAFFVLTGAGLLLSGQRQLLERDTGFIKDRVLTLQFVLPEWKHEQRVPWVNFFERLEEGLASLVGVENVGITSVRPLDAEDQFVTITAAGDRALLPPSEMPLSTQHTVSRGYFDTLGVPLVDGRLFDTQDDDRTGAERVAVISQSLAEYLWPGELALDKRVAFEFEGPASDLVPYWRRIVGVVGEVQHMSLREPPGFAIYVPYKQRSRYFETLASPKMTVLVRTTASSEAIKESVRRSILSLDETLPIQDIQSMSEVIHGKTHELRMLSYLIAFFAGLSVLLSLVGLYAVTSYSAAAMTREVGIRMALGADSGQILGQLLRQSLVAISLASLIGMSVALSLPWLLERLLYGVEPMNPALLLVEAALLALVALIASLLPAWRVSRIQPSRALRYE